MFASGTLFVSLRNLKTWKLKRAQYVWCVQVQAYVYLILFKYAQTVYVDDLCKDVFAWIAIPFVQANGYWIGRMIGSLLFSGVFSNAVKMTFDVHTYVNIDFNFFLP